MAYRYTLETNTAPSTGRRKVAGKKKFALDQVSFSNWQDPRLSIHPARGGPQNNVTETEAQPTFRYKLKVPEPTDDEDSEVDKKDDAQGELLLDVTALTCS